MTTVLADHRFRASSTVSPAETVGARVRLAMREKNWTGEDLRSRLAPYMNGTWVWPAALLALSIVFERPVGWFLEPSDPDQEIEFPSGLKVRGVAVYGPVLGGNVEIVVYDDAGRVVELTLRF